MKRNALYRWIPAVTAVTIALLFSFFLMFHTFSYDSNRQEMRIASKAWSDFGAHIPLIRSFSMGPNLGRLIHLTPIESPLYPGEPVRYHFGFYALVGILEKLGLRIDWALNIPSAIGFFLLMILIFWFSYELFANYSLSLLSVLFFLFNGSLSFLNFFRQHPFSSKTVTDIMTNSRFPAFGPWDGGNITAFWTMNIYTNQRHLALSYALVLAMMVILTKGTKHSIKCGLLFGAIGAFLIFINFAAAGIALVFCGWMFIADRKTRIPILVSLAVLLPAFLLLQQFTMGITNISWQPGYLIHGPLTIHSFISYWWENLGLQSIFIPLGLLMAPRPIRRRFLAPLVLLFVLPNLYRFSPDMVNNHKFFNFFVIIGNMFSAYALMRLWRFASHFYLLVRLPARHRFAQALAGGFVYSFISIFIFFLTLSGIIDFFPIVNDYHGGVADIPINADARFFVTHTQPSDIVANSTWFYHPASIAGRAIFSGYTYFTWSYGYDQSLRESVQASLYKAPDALSLCKLLTDNHISYIELSTSPESYLRPNDNLWNALPSVYENPQTHLRIYKTDTICVP